MNQRWIRTSIGLILTILMLIPVVQNNRPELIERFEYELYDLRLRQFLSEDQDPRIVIIDVDEKSLAAEGRWPWNRTKLARLLDQLFDQYGVVIVGFDMVFSEADRSIDLTELKYLIASQDNASQSFDLNRLLSHINADLYFSQAVKNRPVVLGYMFDRSRDRLQVGNPGHSVISEDQRLQNLPIPEATGVISSLSHLQKVSVWNGFFDNPMVDSDGVFRRVPLLQRYQGQYYPALSLALILALFDEHEVDVTTEQDITGTSEALVAIDVAGINVPVDQFGAVLVPYRGPQRSFPYISATDVLHGKAPAEVLEGAIVLVGTSAAGLLDLRVTPINSHYSGVEIHANIISGILDGSILHQPDYTLGVELVQLMISGLLLSFLIPRVSVLLSTFITFAWLGSVLFFNLYAWGNLYWVIPLGYTLILVALLYIFLQVSGYFFEARNVSKLANQFSQYIPPEVVKELSQQHKRVQLSGENREMTVFFSDVRDFTSLSEQLTPQQLTRLMNIYLTGMTQIIHEYRGTVDKYMGDAVMAFWGAPLEDQQHTTHALNSAMRMLELMPELNKQLKREGLPEIRVGMGINSGPMNVGNMGSSFRMAYTVLGDSVNLASRLEGLTKFYDTPLLVSGEVAEQAPDYFFRKIDRVQVKGRNEPVELFQPLGLKEQCSKEQQEAVMMFSKGIKCYVEKDWDQARSIFDRYLEFAPDDRVTAIYLERIEEFIQSPPEESWDAVFSHSSK